MREEKRMDRGKKKKMIFGEKVRVLEDMEGW